MTIAFLLALIRYLGLDWEKAKTQTEVFARPYRSITPRSLNNLLHSALIISLRLG